MMQKKPYAVVIFLASSKEEETTDVIPASWLTPKKQHCYWPPVKSSAASKLVRQLTAPGTDWTICEARCLKFCGKIYVVFIISNNNDNDDLQGGPQK